MSVPFRLPDGNAIVDRIPPADIRGVGPGAPCEAVAQYHADHVMDDDITLTVLHWTGNEYDYEYVILVNNTNPDDANLHRADLVDGAYARASLIDAIHAFLNNTTDGLRATTQAVRHALHEPYDSKQEYLDETDKRDQAEWERERRNIHDQARDEWEQEKHSRQVINELERTKHELNIPDFPEVTDEVEEVCKQYVNDELTFHELQQRLDELLDKQSRNQN